MSDNYQKKKKRFVNRLRSAWQSLQNKSSESPSRIESRSQPGSTDLSPTNSSPNISQTTPSPQPSQPDPTPQTTPPAEPSHAPDLLDIQALNANRQNPPRSSSSIVCDHAQEKKTPTKPVPTTTPGKKIDWGGLPTSDQADTASLIGIEDAFDHTPLQPGERVAFCSRDKVAYHLVTWEFLRAQNQGRCCICGQSAFVNIITLPGIYVPPPPVAVPVFRPEVQIRQGEKIISLKEVPYHVNLAVIVQDYVHRVHRSQKGTYFIRFEPLAYGEPVYSGFKAVVFNDYVSRWTDVGLSIESYARRNIRVRGVVQKHEFWGIEILVNSPRMIEIVDS